jgi:hypothetical protein
MSYLLYVLQNFQARMATTAAAAASKASVPESAKSVDKEPEAKIQPAEAAEEDPVAFWRRLCRPDPTAVCKFCEGFYDKVTNGACAKCYMKQQRAQLSLTTSQILVLFPDHLVHRHEEFDALAEVLNGAPCVKCNQKKPSCVCKPTSST